MGKRGPKSLIDDQLIQTLYLSGLTCTQIETKTGYNKKTVNRHLNSMNVNMRTKGTTLNTLVKEDYFLVESHEMYYWLGFIYGDGNIYKNRLSIQLSNRDKKHLEKFRKTLNITRKIKDRVRTLNGKEFRMSQIEIVNYKLVNTLKKVGILPNKSHSNVIPDIPSKYLHIFFLGLLDADGWVTVGKDGRYRIGWAGNEASIDLLLANLPCPLKKYDHGNIFQVATSNQNKVKTISEWLLKDSVYSLPRKRPLLLLARDLERSETTG
jgi:hypothetical protein